MNREYILGALRFPVFLAVWSIGLVLLSGAFYPADAALVRGVAQESPYWVEVQEVPRVADLAGSLEDALRKSDVVAGVWQPTVDWQSRKAPVSEIIATVEIEAPPVVEEAEVNSVTNAKPLGLEVVKVSHDEVGRPTSTEAIQSSEASDTKRSARYLLQEGRETKAYDILLSTIVEGRSDTEYLGLFALAALQVGRLEEARVVYEKLTRIDPDNQKWWAGLAVVQQHLGGDAATAFARVARLAGEGSSVQRLAISALGSTG